MRPLSALLPCVLLLAASLSAETITLNYTNSAVFDTQISGPSDDPATTTRDEPNFNFDSFYALSVRAGITTRHLGLLQVQGFVSNLRIPPGSTVSSASLRLYLNDDLNAGFPRTVRLHRMLRPWTTDQENPTTWNNPENAFGTDGIAPDGVEASAAATAEITLDAGSGRFVTADVTADVQAWVSGSPNFGWVILTDNADDGAAFRTTNHARFNTAEAQRPATRPPGTPPDPIQPLNRNYADLDSGTTASTEWRQVQSPTLTITYTPAPAATDTRLTDAAFFGSGDADANTLPDGALLDYVSFPALAQVRSAALTGNMPAARVAFAAYLRSRTQPVIPDPADWTANVATTPPNPGTSRLGSSTTAEKALALQFTADSTTYTFSGGLPIDWEYSPTGSSNFTQYMNRFAYAEDLAKAYVSTGNELYLNGQASPRLHGFSEILRDWILSNPAPAANLNGGGLQAWTTMQAGLRAGHFWPRAWQRLVRSSALTDDFLVLWAKSYHEHGTYLRAYRASGNSLAMETNGLFMVSTLFPDFLASADWRSQALARLASETGAGGQIYPDGAQTELTPLYHLTSLRHFAGVLRTALANGITVPSSSNAPIEAMFDYLTRIVEPGLNLPDLNDSDQANTGTLSSWMQLGRQLHASRTDFDWFATSRASGAPPSFTSALVPYAGQAVMRSGWDAQARYLLMEGGPLGTSHHHDDKLGLVVTAHGIRMIIDSGRYAYDGSIYNAYAHSPNAHSVVHIGPFRQSRRLSAGVFRADTPYDIEWRSSPEFDYATASFGELPGEVFRNGTSSSSPTLAGASHRRHVLFDKAGGYWIVVDDVVQPDSTARDIVAQFHLNALGTAIDASQRVTLGAVGGASMTLTPLVEGGLTASITSGQTSPEVLGWQLSGGSGSRTAIPVARFTRNTAGRVQLATVLATAPSGTAAAAPTVSRLSTGSATLFGLRVTWSDGRPSTDLIVNLDRGNPLQWSGQSYSTGAVVIQNGGSPYAWGQTVSVQVDAFSAIEGQAHRPTFTFTRSGGDNTVPLTVNYTVSGTASTGSDFATLSGTLTIPANETSARIRLRLIDDAIAELSESVSLTVIDAAGYTANGSRASATVTLNDDDLLSQQRIEVTLPPGASATTVIQVSRPSASEGIGQVALSAVSSDYTARKTGQPGGPEFVWDDISSTGTAQSVWYQVNTNGTLGASTTWPSASMDDRVTESIAFTGGFTFPFYGEATTRLRLSTNGVITLGTSSTAPDINMAYMNTNLPGPGGTANWNRAPRAAVMPFWDDLYLDPTAAIYTRQLADRFIIQFQKLRTYSNANIRVTVQVVLRSDGTVDLYYYNVPTSGVAYVVGIQNRDRNRGVQVGTNAANAANVGSLTAVRFSAPLTWLTTTPSSLSLEPGSNSPVSFAFATTGLSAGNYTTNVSLSADQFAGGSITLPVSLTISSASAPSNLAATYSPSPDAVLLSWQDNSANETAFILERRTGLDPAWTALATVSANAIAYSDTSIVEATGYTYRLRAAHPDGDSGWSNEAGIWTEQDFTTDPIVTISTTTHAAEGGPEGMFTLTRTPASASELSVNLSLSGTASPGSDYASLPNLIVFPAGQTTVSMSVQPIDDPIVEALSSETVTATLLAGSGYVIGGPGSATVNITDNDSFASTQVLAPSVRIVSASSVELTWTDNFETNTKYRVRRSTDGVTWTGFDASQDAGSYLFTGLGAGQSYSFQVRAEKSTAPAATSPWSAQLSATPSERSAWLQERFGTSSATGTAAWNADPDADGLDNLLEYALASDPLSAGATAPVRIIESEGRLSVEFLRARSDLIYTVEASSDLVAWESLATNPGSVSLVSPALVQDGTLLATPGRRFLRVRVTEP